VVGQGAHVEATLVGDRAADVAHGHDPQAGRRQQERQRATHLAEALQHHPAAGERHVEVAEHGP
jgi:hypothetical protein